MIKRSTIITHVMLQLLGQIIVAYLFLLGGYDWSIVPREGLMVGSLTMMAFMSAVAAAAASM